MGLKHSKFKNTGLLFELLVRQIASDTLENKDSPALGIIKKYFSKSELAKEYKIYKILSSYKGLNESKATILLESAVQSQKKLSHSNLRKEKYSLISAIKENYNVDEFFKAKIDNYKLYASIYLLFESASSKDVIAPEIITDVKYSIVENLTKTNTEEKIKSEILEEYSKTDHNTRTLIYKLLVKKFNDKYNNELNDRQKNLLREYVNEVTMTPKLKEYVNEQSMIVRNELKDLLPEIKDKTTQIKVKQVAEIIKPISKKRSVNDDDILNLFNYYQLVDEINLIVKK